MACSCSAYKFPHRPASGACSGQALLDEVFDAGVWCFDCDFHHITNEREAVGEGSASRFSASCSVASVKDCPGANACLRGAA